MHHFGFSKVCLSSFELISYYSVLVESILLENQGNVEMIEHTDILKVTTGTPSHKKQVVEEKTKQQKQTKTFRSQQVL